MSDLTVHYQIYLSGGGDEHQSFPLDKFFFDKLPIGGQFLYIPVALRGHKLWSTASTWMTSVISLHERDDLKFEIWGDLLNKKREDLTGFSGIYIGGGNTWVLMKELKESGVDRLLMNYITSTGPVYGGSAGAIIFGKSIDTSEDKNNIGWTDSKGLGLLGDYSIVCHFKTEQEEIYKDWALKNKLPIICLPEETGLIAEHETVKCVGSMSCVIYVADGGKFPLHPGEVFSLK